MLSLLMHPAVHLRFLCQHLHVPVYNGPRTLLGKGRFETVSKSKRKRKNRTQSILT